MEDQGPGVPTPPEGEPPTPAPPPDAAAPPPPPASTAPPVPPPMAPPMAPPPGVGQPAPPMMVPQGPGMGTGMMRWNGQPLPPDFAEKKILAGILGILLGSLGIHKFILGYNTEGGIMLGVTVLSWVLTLVIIGILGVFAVSIIGIIEGIIYLTKSDQDFVMTYGVNKKGWF